MKLCKCSADMTGYKDNMNDVKLTMENEVKEDKGSSLYLNIGNLLSSVTSLSLTNFASFMLSL
jgi:hypothetical protein